MFDHGASKFPLGDEISDMETHLITIGIKEGLQVDYIWMRNEPHDLQLTILHADEYG